MNIGPILKQVGRWGRRNAPKLLAGMAIATEAIGFWMMHKKAPVVRDKLDALGEEATFKDKAKVVAANYWAPASMFLLSAGSITTSCIAGERKAALLTGLYSASEAALHNYEHKMEELVGKEKAEEVKQEVTQATLLGTGRNEGNDIVRTGKGSDLFREPFCGWWIETSREAVELAIAKFQKDVTSEMWGSVRRLREYLGLKGEDLDGYFGYNVDDIFKSGSNKGLEYRFVPATAPNGRAGYDIYFYDQPKLYDGTQPPLFD